MRAFWIPLALLLWAAPTWATDYTITVFSDDETDNGNCTLREAIDAAVRDIPRDECPAGTASDSIELLAGTYTFNQGEYFSQRTGVDLTIRGQGPGVTTVSMGFQNRFLRLLKPGGLANHIGLEGFTLVGGRVVGTLQTAAPGGAVWVAQTNLTLATMLFSLNATVNNGDGGAVFVEATNASEDTALTILDTSFDTNTSASAGGGLAVDGDRIAAVIRRSTFVDNAAGSGGGFGLVLTESPGPILQDVRVAGNASDAAGGGGRVFFRPSGGGTVLLQGCDFEDNTTSQAGLADSVWGSGLAITSIDALVTIESSRFAGNHTTNTSANRDAEQFGIVLQDDAARVRLLDVHLLDSTDNALQVSLEADRPFDHGLALSHTTIVGNAAVGRYDEVGTTRVIEAVLMETSIVFDNAGTELTTPHSMRVNGNVVNVDPVFVDAAGGDYRLQEISPAIDTTTFQNLSNLIDLDIRARPIGDGFDAGAFEFVPPETAIFADGFESGDTIAW